jgi:hypothetical protein
MSWWSDRVLQRNRTEPAFRGYHLLDDGLAERQVDIAVVINFLVLVSNMNDSRVTEAHVASIPSMNVAPVPVSFAANSLSDRSCAVGARICHD